MIYVDAHCHLDHSWLAEDLDSVIENAKDSGVKIIITNGIDHTTNVKSLELAKKYDIVKAAIGLYPPDALSRETGAKNNFDLDDEIKFIRENKDNIVAIGEVGMDGADSGAEFEIQEKVFRAMIELAIDLNKPVIIHTRKAEARVLDILESYDYKKVVLHCFFANKKLMQRAVENGYYFTIPANVVRSEQMQILVKMANINKLITETDSPYLPPVSGERNEPKNVVTSVKKIAEIKGFEEEEVANNIFMNYQRLFT